MPFSRFATWLETRWVSPAFSGWLMAGLALFFFAAATNTMAGWLYVISGVMLAILAIAALLPARSLQGIRIRRSPIQPVSVGDRLTLELLLENPTPLPKSLIQIQDNLPAALSLPITTTLELIAPHSTYRWTSQFLTERRGIYRWQTVQLRTAAPLGLFWCRRSLGVEAIATVYPTILPLTHCPLIDEIGRDEHRQISSADPAQPSTEGLTRTLRPYRWGDSTRLIHWRTSARYGELRVRELESYTGGQEVVVALDSAIAWNPADFEQAVSAAASLYFYALRHKMQVSLWTAQGQYSAEQAVLTALAGVQFAETPQISLPDVPLLWLTSSGDRLPSLPPGSRWLLWSTHPGSQIHPGLVIQPTQSLLLQLQSAV
jgi:uncharacterized protein (DUF58 family)